MSGVLFALVGLASYILFLVAWIVIKAKTRVRFVWWGILGCAFIGLGIVGAFLIPILMFSRGPTGFRGLELIIPSLGILATVGVLMNAMAFLRLALTITHLEPPGRRSRAERESERNVW